MAQCSHDPMNNNVKRTSMFCDNCQDFGELPFQKEGKYEIIINDDMREFINQENQQLQKEIKEALTIKIQGKSFSRGSKHSSYVYCQKSDSSR